MASITVLVGQCGCQLGADFLTTVAGEAAESSDAVGFQQAVSNTFFRPTDTFAEEEGTGMKQGRPVARCIMVDMEPKAIEGCSGDVDRRGIFQFAPLSQAVMRGEGSANNWSFGFHEQGPSCREQIVSRLRSELEQCDAVSNFHVVHSAAGGTGSGVGSYVSEVIRDEFAMGGGPLHHTLVWPFTQGEMTTQWLNALHTLHHLHQTADSVHMLFNDDVLGKPSSGERPELRDVNRAMSSHLAALHLPSRVLEVPPPAELQKRSHLIHGGKNLSTFQPVAYHPATWYDVVESLTLDPRRKFFDSFLFPPAHLMRDPSQGRKSQLHGDVSATWQSVVHEPLRWVSRRRAHSSLMVLRGAEAVAAGSTELQGGLHSLGGTIGGLHGSNVPFRRHPVHAAVYSTSSHLAERIETCATKAESMVDAGAFIHHFERYGADRAAFQDALLSAYDIIEHYRPSV